MENNEVVDALKDLYTEVHNNTIISTRIETKLESLEPRVKILEDDYKDIKDIPNKLLWKGVYASIVGAIVWLGTVVSRGDLG